MGSSILQGFEEQLNQDAQDVVPYYHKIYNNSIYGPHPEDQYYHENHHESEESDLLISLIFLLSCLTLICFIIMILLCIRVCCSSYKVDTNNPNVPPPFIYVLPFSQLQTAAASQNDVASPPNYQPAPLYVKTTNSYKE